MKVFHPNRFIFPLPEGHRFPLEKYRLLQSALLLQGILSPEELVDAPLATREMITLAHTGAYYQAVMEGSLHPKIIRQIGLPWSPELAQRALATVGGSICAAEEALHSGISGNLSGGTHHALADQGNGYCVFNDLAVTALYLLKGRKVRRLAIVDLDVHQGNGNAAILGDHPEIFILSMHGEKNYPFRKVPSTLDIDLADNTGDLEYLFRLDSALTTVFEFEPELVLYLAGVDPLKEDYLGKLSLTLDGIAERDRMVLSACKDRGIPVALVLGGGYSRPIEHTVQAHLGTYAVVREVYGTQPNE